MAGTSDIKETSSCSPASLSQITSKPIPARVIPGLESEQQKLELADFPEVQETLLETDLQLQGVAIYQIVAEQEGYMPCCIFG